MSRHASRLALCARRVGTHSQEVELSSQKLRECVICFSLPFPEFCSTLCKITSWTAFKALFYSLFYFSPGFRQYFVQDPSWIALEASISPGNLCRLLSNVGCNLRRVREVRS